MTGIDAMSLVNKMLQDLEARQSGASSPAAKPVYQDLRAVPLPRRTPPARVVAAIGLVVVLGLGLYVAAKIFLEEPAADAVPATARTTVPPPIPVPSNAPPTTAPERATSPAPEPAKPAPAAMVPEAPAGDSQEVRTAVADVDDAKPAVVAPLPEAPSSPPETGAGIVKQAESPPTAPASPAQRPANATARKERPNAITPRSPESVAVVDKKVRPLTPEERAEAGYRGAVALLEQGRADDALRQLREALAAHPKHIKARELAAGIELQRGHWREAQRLLEEGLRQVPNQYLLARLLARVYLEHGAEAKALAVMENASPAGSDDAEFSALLGLLYQRAGRHADAVKVYERALALNPADARTWLGFAISLEGTEQWGAAKNAYARAQRAGLAPTLARYAEQRLAALKDK